MSHGNSDIDTETIDEDGWEDTEIIDDSDVGFDLVQNESVIEKKQPCWNCNECNLINNVELTVEKYNMKCCGCGITNFIPDETPIINCTNWNCPRDYFVKFHLIEESKPIWICNVCSYENSNLQLDHCEICETQRIYNKDIQSEDMDDILDIEKYCKGQPSVRWKCPNCSAFDRMDRCSKCNCNKPINSKYGPIYIDIVYGFCRMIDMNIPSEIQYLFLKYMVYYPFGTDILVNKLECRYGKRLVFSPEKYVWRVQYEKKNIKYMVERDIEIGVVDGTYYYGIIQNGKLCVPDTEDPCIDTNDLQYCRQFRAGDIITVILDCKNDEISYGINDEWYGVAFNEMVGSCYGYQLYIKGDAFVKIIK